MNPVNHVLKLLSEASDEHLMMSRKNCHIKGLHSIVLYSDKFNRLLRLYLTTPDHELHDSTRDSLVINLGVHSHRYDLTLSRVHGDAFNIEYVKSNYEKAYRNQVRSYMFRSKDDFGYCGDVFLSRGKLSMIDRLFLPKDALHTVFVRECDTASWLVQEGFEERNYTMLYTNKPVECQSHEFFNSADEVRSFVTDYYRDNA